MITHVAIIRDGIIYSLPKPNRHHNIFAIMPPLDEDGDIEGFIDNNGKFLNRDEAYMVAINFGQINRRPGGYNGPKLFSEDLW